MAGAKGTARPAEAITRPSLADRVVSAVARSITEGRLPPGTRLPSGQEMAEQYGVSLAVIREAVSSLRAEGLIETRQGAGAFVARSSVNQPFRIQPTPGSRIEAMRDIFELRRGVEVTAAGLDETA